MNEIETIFVSLLKEAVFQKEVVEEVMLSPDSIKTLERLSQKYHCQILICNELKKHHVAGVSAEFTATSKAIFGRNHINLLRQSELLKLFQNAGIPCAVLKGSSVAMYYPEPLLRVFGDIDLLVPEQDYDRAVQLLLGDQERNENAEMHKFHYALEYKGMSVEIHKHITEYSTEEECLPDVMQSAFDELEVGKIDSFTFPMLGKKHQAIALLLHLKRHMIDNQTGMRMLLDWLVFADHITVQEWNESIYPGLKATGVHLLADALFMLSDQYFGTDSSEKIHSSIPPETISLLMEDFVSIRVLDSSLRFSGSVATIYIESAGKGKLSKMIATMNYLARADFKFAKYKITLPVCWLLVAGRYLYRLATRKSVPLSLARVHQHVSGKEQLFRILNMKH